MTRIRYGYDESGLESRLAKRYAAPAYAFMTQVYNGTGSSACRRADAVAFSLYPSRGLHLHGFEIKSNRGDWLNELRNPAKADEVARFCDFWWIVAAPDVVRDVDPFPAGWGLFEASGTDGLRAKHAAQKLTPEALTRPIIASLFRRFAESVPYLTEKYVSKDDVEKLAEERAAEIERRKDPDRNVRKVYDELLARVTEFETAIGWTCITGHTWKRAEELGAAFRVLVDHEATKTLDERLRFDIDRLRRALAELEASREAIGSVAPLDLERQAQV